MSPALKSAQPGMASGRKRRSPVGRREVEDFLPGGEDAVAEQVREIFGQPRAEREHERVGFQRRAAAKPERFQRAALLGRHGSAHADIGRPPRRSAGPASAPRAAPSSAPKPGSNRPAWTPVKSIIGKRRAISAGVQRFGRQAQRAMRGHAVRQIGFLAREEEQHAVRNEDRQAGIALSAFHSLRLSIAMRV